MRPTEINAGADPRSSGGASLIDAVADWLMTQALGESSMEALFEGCSNRLRAAGIPLLRSHIAFRTLHPLFEAVSLTWRRGQGVETTGHVHGSADLTQWRQSPYYHMMETEIPYLRRRLAGPDAVRDFPVLADFYDEGATDYMAYMVEYGGIAPYEGLRTGLCGSWTTDRESGFNDADLKSLLRIQRRLAVACKVTIKDQIARNVVTTYLGPNAGNQVLQGHIKRGDGETVHAVIWLSDLRDSTRMADTMTAVDFLRVLNGYFECTAGAVLAHGGETLMFIGDAVLAMFPIRDGDASARPACEAALAAARDAESRLAALNREREGAEEGALSFGLGLHVGDVVYGNIGVPDRLQFTVVGAAVNEAARLEYLTKPLGRRILVSAEFANNLPIAWESLGRHELKGLGQRRKVYAPPPV